MTVDEIKYDLIENGYTLFVSRVVTNTGKTTATGWQYAVTRQTQTRISI